MTLIKKSVAIAVVIAFVSTATFAQNGVGGPVPSKPELKTLNQYNNYVKTLDLAQISADDKRWLETKYNKLVDALDAKYHRKAADKTCVTNNEHPAFSCIDTKVAMQKSVGAKGTTGSK